MHLFRNWFRSLSSARRIPVPRPQRAKQRPRQLLLEGLEERTVLSILFSNTGTRTITDTGGPILNHMQLDLIFWGTGWNSGRGPALRTSMQNTATAILNSTYFDGLAQYRSIGHGSLVRSDTITTTNPPASFTTGFGGDVSNFVTNNINNNTLPSPNGQILYFVIPQPGSTTSDCGCGGRHLAGIASSNRVFPYGLLSDPTGVSVDRLSWIMSHEMAEAASNPEWNITVGGVTQAAFHVPGSNGDEIGDGEPDGNYLYRLNGSLVQAFLSQSDHVYIVTTGQTQNFIVNSSHQLTVNGDQLANKNDAITVGLVNNGVRINLNNEVAQFEPSSITGITVNTGTGNDNVAVEQTTSISPVTVNLGGGTDLVNISPVLNNLDNIQGNVTVHGGSGFDTLQIWDSNNSVGRTYTMTASTVTRGGSAVITYGSLAINSVVVNGGFGANVFNVQDTEAGFATTINNGSSADVVNVLGTTGALTVNGSFVDFSNSDLVNVGNAGSLQNIRGSVTVSDGFFATTRLNVNDSADTTGRNVTLSINGGTSTGTITGLTASGAIITFPQFNLAALTVSGGTAANTFTVNNTGTGSLTTINSGTGNGSAVSVRGTTGPLTINLQNTLSNVTIGSTANSLDPIQGAISLSGMAVGQVAVLDQGTSAAKTYTIGAASLTRTGAAAINYTNVFSMTLNCGSGGNLINVQANPGGLSVNAGTGNNTINVGSATNSLNGFGTVGVHGQGGVNVLNVNDQGTTTAQTYSVQTVIPSVGRAGVFIAYSGISSLALRAGSGGNTINVVGTLAATPVTVFAGALNDIVNVGDSGNHLDSIQSTLTVNGQAGTTRLNINDQGTTTGKTYTITSAAVTRTGGPAINYSSLNSLTLNGGSGGNTINVESTAAGTTTTVNAGTGGSTINLSPTAHNLATLAGLVNINGQGGTNTLNAFDQATTFSQGFAGDNLYQDHMTRLDGNPLTERTIFAYQGIQTMNVSAGRGDNGTEAFGVVSTPSGVPVNIANAGTSTSYVQFIVGYPLENIQGALTIHGKAGGTDFLEVSDFSPNPQTFTVTANTVSRTGMAPIVYDNQTVLALATSSQALATVNVQSTLPVTYIALLKAGDQATLSAPGIHNTFGVASGGAVSVTVDDSSDSMPRTAAFTTDPTYRYLLNGLAASPIYLNLDPGSSMQVLGGSGGNTFNVQGLLAGTTLSLSGGSGTNTLQGPNSDTTWQITGSNAGSFTGGVSFTAMQNLVGGAGADTFVFADGAGVSGNIDGGGGTNTLDYSAYASSNVLVNLQTAFATGVGSIANIQNAKGANGGGASGLYNILVGNGGNVLTGGNARRNLLIAGASASTLIGGDDDDILIAGTTDYDADPQWQAAFAAIMNEWTQATDYTARVDHLMNGGGLNDPYLLNSATVHSNGGGNALTGHGGGATERNLYFASLADTTDQDPSLGEQLISIT
jgi:acrosin